MKLIIEIPEETYNDIQSRDWKNGELIFSEEWKAIHNGTPIPDNATNGQVIQTLFKPNRVERTNVIVEEYTFDEDWWNAPYQKGGKE